MTRSRSLIACGAAFVAGAVLFETLRRAVNRAPIIPIFTSGTATWVADGTGALVNLRHLRVIATKDAQVVGEWATCPTLRSEPVVAIETFKTAEDAVRALSFLGNMLGAPDVT